MKDRMRAGVSSACFFPQETACSVEKLAQWKIPQIEIFFNSFQELKPDYLERLRSCCQASGTKIVSIHPFTSNSESFYFFTDYPGRLQDGLARQRNSCKHSYWFFTEHRLPTTCRLSNLPGTLPLWTGWHEKSTASPLRMKMWCAAAAVI